MEPNSNCREHLANERTFLAWVRTSIAIIAFGFVIEKFSLFMKQMSFILGKTTIGNAMPAAPGHSSVAGIFLVALGTLMSVLGYIKFKKIQKQIDQRAFKTSSSLDLILTSLIFIAGIFLIVYLIKSVS